MAGKKQPLNTLDAFLRRAVNSKPLFHGREARLYALPFSDPDKPDYLPGMENYLLRTVDMDAKEFRQKLNKSTALVPTDIRKGANLGQALVQLSDHYDITIVRRQSGDSLEALLDRVEAEETDKGHSYPRARAWIALAETIKSLQQRTGTNPFLPIFRDGYRHALALGGLDFDPGNILLDPVRNRLSLVDQPFLSFFLVIHPQPYAHNAINYQAERFFGQDYDDEGPLFKTPRAGTALDTEYQYALHYLKSVVREAKREAVAEIDTAPPAKQALKMMKTKDIKAVALTDPPKALLEQLNQLSRRADIHRDTFTR